MKKLSILLGLSVLMFAGCLTAPQEITFTTQDNAYITPGVDTIDFTTAFTTNAYLSKIICADAETLDTEGPALMSAYPKPSVPTSGTSFNLETSKFEKFDGQLCDVYVLAWDDSTIEETEAKVRVNIGASPEVEVEVTDEICTEDDEDCEVTEEEGEEATDEEVVVEDDTAEEETTDEGTTDEEAAEETTEETTEEVTEE